MSLSGVNVGNGLILSKQLKRIAIVGAVAAAIVAGATLSTIAGGETRSISLYHIHTKESLTVTYMKDGRYVPSAMAKINYVLRDWRKDKVIRIDPKTIDVMWELHADLGSQEPIRIICGYRSAGTNAFLKRIGRNVARHSQHINGKAIDFYFTDVPTQKIRDSALVREVGGVGYYRSAGGPTGFVHLDSGKVRYWGPRIGATQMASIWRNAKKLIGRRLTNSDSTLVATAEVTAPRKKSGGIFSWLNGKKKPVSVEPPVAVASAPNILYGGDDSGDLADLAADASAAAKRKDSATPINGGEMAALAASASENTDEPEATVRVGTPIPRPRLKPIEIMMMAAARMNIEPASAPPPDELNHKTKTTVALLDTNALIVSPAKRGPKAAEKSDLGVTLPEEANGLPNIRPVVAAAVIEDVIWWPEPTADQPAKQVTQRQVVVRDGKGGIDPALLKFATE